MVRQSYLGIVLIHFQVDTPIVLAPVGSRGAIPLGLHLVQGSVRLAFRNLSLLRCVLMLLLLEGRRGEPLPSACATPRSSAMPRASSCVAPPAWRGVRLRRQPRVRDAWGRTLS